MIALVFYRAVRRITLFLGVTFTAVSEMSFFLAYMFFELGNHQFRPWDWCWEKGYISVLECYNFVINITLIGNQILFHIIGAVLLYFTMRKIVRDYREKDYAIHRTELLFILTPGLTGLMVCTLLRITIGTAENGVPETLYDRYPSLMVIMPVILLLLLFSILFEVKLFQDMICWNREKSSRIILEKQVGSLQEYMGEMERVYYVVFLPLVMILLPPVPEDFRFSLPLYFIIQFRNCLSERIPYFFWISLNVPFPER